MCRPGKSCLLVDTCIKAATIRTRELLAEQHILPNRLIALGIADLRHHFQHRIRLGIGCWMIRSALVVIVGKLCDRVVPEWCSRYSTRRNCAMLRNLL
jgi:hypothetical protein